MKGYFFTFLILVSLTSMSQTFPGNLKSYALRLTPHQDVRKALRLFAEQNGIKAGCIITAVGSLEQVNLRYANQEKGTLLKGHFEVLSLSGTFSDTSAHLHLSVADSTGRVLGGHLLDSNLIFTTLELVVGDLENAVFDREKDPTYGFDELTIKPRSTKK